MTWNQATPKSGLAHDWHWYRDRPDVEPYPVKVYDVVGIEYAWLCGDEADHPKSVRVSELHGEFLGVIPKPVRLTPIT